MNDILFLHPSGKWKGRPVAVIRDWSGGLLPAAIPYPPVDLAGLATWARASGFKADFLDADSRGWGAGEIAGYLREQPAPALLLISTWYSLEDDLALIQAVKAALPDLRVLFAGANVTVDPRPALAGGVDYVIQGEPEMPLLDFLRGQPERSLAHRSDGAVVLGQRAWVARLDDLPIPDRGLMDVRRYRSILDRRAPYTTIQASRGCPYACAFCPDSLWFGAKVRYRSPAHVVEEIAAILDRNGIPQINFKDLVFTHRRDWALEICEAILRRNVRFSWRCLARVDEVDSELLILMRRAGCHQISFGLETGSQALLDRHLKSATVEQARMAVHLVKSVGLEATGLFVLGLAGETPRTVRETLALALSLPLDFAHFNMLVDIHEPFFHYSPELRAETLRANLRFYGRPRKLLAVVWRVLQDPAQVPAWFQTAAGVLRT
ncbi:MAG: radical SAM protein [Nitrospirae bacterium]|nr:radical SAM protein [Nitrospirota bacterium]